MREEPHKQAAFL